MGETALGIKGRIGFEAGAALLLIGAHRELEKLVLTKWQVFWKDQLGRFYGDRLHEGHYFDPALRDIEALLTSSQRRVSGETRVRVAPGRFMVTGTRSPFSMMDRSVATYGEENRLWTGDEARAFARIGAIPSLLAQRAGEAGSGPFPLTAHRSPLTGRSHGPHNSRPTRPDRFQSAQYRAVEFILGRKERTHAQRFYFRPGGVRHAVEAADQPSVYDAFLGFGLVAAAHFRRGAAMYVTAWVIAAGIDPGVPVDLRHRRPGLRPHAGC